MRVIMSNGRKINCFLVRFYLFALRTNCADRLINHVPSLENGKWKSASELNDKTMIIAALFRQWEKFMNIVYALVGRPVGRLETFFRIVSRARALGGSRLRKSKETKENGKNALSLPCYYYYWLTTWKLTVPYADGVIRSEITSLEPREEEDIKSESTKKLDRKSYTWSDAHYLSK